MITSDELENVIKKHILLVNIKISINEMIFYFYNDKLMYQYNTYIKQLYGNYFSLLLSDRIGNYDNIKIYTMKLASDILSIEISNYTNHFILISDKEDKLLYKKLSRVLKINEIYK